jgi:hypothetical protein
MSSILDLSTSGVIIALTKAVMQGKTRFRIFFAINTLLLLTGFVLKLLADYQIIYYSFNIAAYILIGFAILIFLGIYAYQMTVEETAAKAEIKKAEERIKENPKEPTAAWELARIKLENYLNRNLSQIRWIFLWTVGIMIAGFTIIGYGILKVYQPSSNISAGIITTASGLIVEFIGATFLVIYKSTMEQAKDYVNVLERINAVGMSVQILENISKDEIKLQDQTRAEIAKQLLDLYGLKNHDKSRR